MIVKVSNNIKINTPKLRLISKNFSKFDDSN